MRWSKDVLKPQNRDRLLCKKALVHDLLGLNAQISWPLTLLVIFQFRLPVFLSAVKGGKPNVMLVHAVHRLAGHPLGLGFRKSKHCIYQYLFSSPICYMLDVIQFLRAITFQISGKSDLQHPAYLSLVAMFSSIQIHQTYFEFLAW